MAAYDALDALIERLTKATWKEREPIKKELEQAVTSFADPGLALDHLEELQRGLDDLELRWEIDEIIEALRPEPEPEPEPEDNGAEVPDDAPPDQLSAADLTLVYDDPRGLALHRTKTGDRWFATQRNPTTGQPQTFELHATEIQQLKLQFQGSPYWVLGAGA